MDVVRLMQMPPRILHQQYSVRDTILYALGIGAGIDPCDQAYVYEKDIQTLPSMAVVLAASGPWFREPQFGIDWKRLLHAEQMLTMSRPLPPEGKVRIDHVLVSPDWHVRSFRIGPDVGSDHFPVVADLLLP